MRTAFQALLVGVAAMVVARAEAKEPKAAARAKVNVSGTWEAVQVAFYPKMRQTGDAVSGKCR